MGSMAAHKRVIEIMFQDANARNDLQVTFAIPYTGILTTSSIWSTFVYDNPIRPKSVNGGILNRLVNMNYFPVAVPVDWARMPGDTDAQKIEQLVQGVSQQADYLIAPTKATIDFHEKVLAWIELNKYTRAIVQQLLQQKWEPINEPIRVTSVEEVQVYRNRSSKRSGV